MKTLLSMILVACGLTFGASAFASPATDIDARTQHGAITEKREGRAAEKREEKRAKHHRGEQRKDRKEHRRGARRPGQHRRGEPRRAG
jgi:Ni/Co efflux regulator RcnB